MRGHTPSKTRRKLNSERPEREAFILERTKIYYAELDKIAGM